MEHIPAHVLLGAYSEGVFPMAEDGEIYWFSPLTRGIIPIDERFHIPRGLKRAMKKEPFEIRINSAFSDVMAGCAVRQETWIDQVIIE
ncbi:MAG: leucyl/phenylalanyl-tRNA--protein transferase, partial [Verrucomicrobiae bacterium]|nr:leucyl/phenylalanyl-tRNA--protein transferase [Verrucomicrobiae bacterium]NNJ86452.1 leucyl/phenylalanyl-tRNA--protein transferase [Akkermansiaceae bacterium]